MNKSLNFEKNNKYFFLGIDGGGTKTVFKLADENGNVLRTVLKGAVNPNDIGMDYSMSLLEEGISEACIGVPLSLVTMFAGIAGGGLTGDNAKLLKAFFEKFGFFAFENGSDIENLVALATEDKCILVIMGTGFIVYALKGKERKRIGGWGQFFDDGGSGYTLGRDAIYAALCEIDGSGEKTVLSELFYKRTGQSAQEHLARFYEGGKKYIASFSDLVFEAAKCGDTVAMNILGKNADYVACRIKAAASFLEASNGANIPVMFSGGISNESEVLFPLIEKSLPDGLCSLRRVETDIADGALNKARAVFEKQVRR